MYRPVRTPRKARKYATQAPDVQSGESLLLLRAGRAPTRVWKRRQSLMCRAEDGRFSTRSSFADDEPETEQLQWVVSYGPDAADEPAGAPAYPSAVQPRWPAPGMPFYSAHGLKYCAPAGLRTGALMRAAGEPVGHELRSPPAAARTTPSRASKTAAMSRARVASSTKRCAVCGAMRR